MIDQKMSAVFTGFQMIFSFLHYEKQTQNYYPQSAYNTSTAKHAINQCFTLVMTDVLYISYHIMDPKRQSHLKVGTDKSQLKVKMQSVSDDDSQKTLLRKPCFDLY